MINNLQILRAFAALNVVLFHTFGHTARHSGKDSELADFFGSWGNCGVDVFFVISGFIMVFIQHNTPKDPVEFIKDRATRIIPLYWSVSLFFVMLLIFMPSSFAHALFDWQHALTSFLFVSRISGFAFPVLDPGWTLEYEMFFYILFGLSLSIKKISSLITVPFVLLGCVLFVDLNVIVLEFAFGMFAGFLYIKGWLKKWGWPLFVSGCVSMLSSLFVDIELARVLRFGVPAFFVTLGCCYLPQMNNKLLILIGSASYSIYIVHTLTLPMFFKVFKFTKIPAADVAADVLTVLCVLFSACVGILVYLIYENPLAKLIKHHTARRHRRDDQGASELAVQS